MKRVMWAVALCVAVVGCDDVERDTGDTGEGDTDVECQGPTGDNLVADGTFDQGLACWWGDNIEIDDEDGAPEGAPPSLVGDNPTGGDILASQATSRDITLEGGTTYDFTFWIRADEDRDVRVFVQEVEPTVHHFYEDMPVGTDWQQVTRTFTAQNDTDEAWVNFQFGEFSDAPVWVDDVYLAPASGQ